MQTLQPGDATTLPTTFSLVGFTIQILLNKNRRNIYLPHVSNPLYSFHFVSSFLWSVSTFVPMWEVSEERKVWRVSRSCHRQSQWRVQSLMQWIHSPSCDMINPLDLCNFWPLCHWFLSEMYEPIHSVYKPYCLKFHWPTFMTQQYVGTKFIFVSLSVSQPCTPYIHNTKSNLKRKSFHSKTQNKMPTVCDKTGAEEI